MNNRSNGGRDPVSFFGGNPNKSYFKVDVVYKLTPDEDPKAQRERRRAQRQALKDAGFKDRYYEYRNDDPVGKARAKRYATKDAAKWEGEVGFDLVVVEGCFL